MLTFCAVMGLVLLAAVSGVFLLVVIDGYYTKKAYDKERNPIEKMDPGV